MSYIQHVTLTTGHAATQPREAASEEALAIVVPWLRNAIQRGTPQLIPHCDGYQALALVEGGALLMTVYGPEPDVGEADAVVTFGVCARSRQSQPLWDMLNAAHPSVVPAMSVPAAPWCGVVLHPAIARHPPATEWLADFERVVAWAWVTRTPDLRAAT